MACAGLVKGGTLQWEDTHGEELQLQRRAHLVSLLGFRVWDSVEPNECGQAMHCRATVLCSMAEQCQFYSTADQSPAELQCQQHSLGRCCARAAA